MSIIYRPQTYRNSKADCTLTLTLTLSSDDIYLNPQKGTGIKMMDAMYFQKKKLETVFYFFDSNGDGRISREEFHKGTFSFHCIGVS